MTEKTATLYMATNKANGKSYIGKTVRRLATRWTQHRCGAKGARPTRFQAAIRQYGEDAFEVRAIAVGPAGEWMNDLEIRAIAAYDTFNTGYNDTKGGDGGLGSKGRVGKKHTAESRAKISASHMGIRTRLGHKNTPEQNEKLRQANLGKKLSPETVAKMMEARKSRVYKKGHKLSEEVRLKMSLARKGQKRSAEFCAAISARMKGHKHTDETKKKLATARKVAWANLSDENRAKALAALTAGRAIPKTEQSRKRLSESQKARWARIKEENNG